MIKQLTVALLAIAGVSASAQNVATLGVSDMKIMKEGDEISVSFTLDPKAYTLKSTREIELTPAFISPDESDTLRLEPVRVAGRNAWYHSRRNFKPGDPVVCRAGSGEPASYVTSVSMLPWMAHSRFKILVSESGCCPGSVSHEMEQEYLAEVDWRPPQSKLASELSYITPAVDTVKSFDISGKAYVSFKVNRTDIDPSYMKNIVELGKIIGTIDTVRRNPDATVRRISLTGYASPEGPYANNVRLAKGRTEAVRGYVGRQYDFHDDVYVTNSVAEDWEGLRDSVAVSTFPTRDEILSLIDDDGIPVSEKNDRLRSGFPSEYAYLLKNVYPWLRHTDYVITYEIRRFTDVEEIRKVMRTSPRNLSLNELFIGARSYPEGSEEYQRAFELAAMLHPDSYVANVNAATALASRGDLAGAMRYLDRAGAGHEADDLRRLVARELAGEGNTPPGVIFLNNK